MIGRGMRAETYNTVDEVPDEVWNAVAPPDFFFTKAFTEVMERSGVEDARYRYIILFEDDKPVGLATLSRFLLKLDLLTGDKWIEACAVSPKMFEPDRLLRGPGLARPVQPARRLPESMGRRPDRRRVYGGLGEGRALHPARLEEGARTRASLTCPRAGYVAAASLPDHELPDLPRRSRSTSARCARPIAAVQGGARADGGRGPVDVREAALRGGPFTRRGRRRVLRRLGMMD